LLPVDRVAGQSRDLKPEHDANLAQTDSRNEFLETIARHAVGSGHPEILIDDMNALRRPAERDRAVAQRVLPSRALAVLIDLPQRRLANVKIGITAQMVGSNTQVAH
jgi:hypothetical protein